MAAQSGPEMLLNTAIKLFKLEGYVETIKSQVKKAVDEGWFDKAKAGVEKIGTFDERLARIERKLGIEPGVEPHSSAGVFLAPVERNGSGEDQSRTGTDN